MTALTACMREVLGKVPCTSRNRRLKFETLKNPDLKQTSAIGSSASISRPMCSSVRSMSMAPNLLA